MRPPSLTSRGDRDRRTTSPPLPRREAAALLALTAAAIAARWLTRSSMVYSWDSVHYVLAQDRYDLRTHQPHPPGSFYYILLARAARLLTGDAHAALLLLGALLSGAIVLVLYRLGRELAGREAGWLAAAIGASAPLFWFYGSVALNYGPSGTLSALAVLGCVRLCRRRDPPWSGLVAGSALGLLGGFRPTDVAFLLPAYLWSLARLRNEPAQRRALASSLAVFTLLTLGWLIPNILNAGGAAAYVAAIRGQEHLFGRSSVFLAGSLALRDAVYTHRRSLESTLGAGWIPVLLSLGILGWSRLRKRRTGEHTGFEVPVRVLAALAVLPAFAFFLLGHFNSPGYAMVYAGLLAALGSAPAAVLLRRLSPERCSRAAAALAVVVLAINTRLFLNGSPLDGGRLGHRSLSYREIADHTGYYQDLARALPRLGRPGRLILLSSWNATDGLRVVQAALPEYAADVAQAVDRVPPMPEAVRSLAFLRLMTPAQIRSAGLPVYAVTRTWEDPGYQDSLFPEDLVPVPIGHGHYLFRIRFHPNQP